MNKIKLLIALALLAFTASAEVNPITNIDITILVPMSFFGDVWIYHVDGATYNGVIGGKPNYTNVDLSNLFVRNGYYALSTGDVDSSITLSPGVETGDLRYWMGTVHHAYGAGVGQEWWNIDPATGGAYEYDQSWTHPTFHSLANPSFLYNAATLERGVIVYPTNGGPPYIIWYINGFVGGHPFAPNGSAGFAYPAMLKTAIALGANVIGCDERNGVVTATHYGRVMPDGNYQHLKTTP